MRFDVCREGVKLVLLFPLFIMRLSIVLMLLLILALVSFVASLGADMTRPFPKWRRAIVHVLRPIAKLIVICMGVSVNLTGWEHYQQALQQNLVRLHRALRRKERMPCTITKISPNKFRNTRVVVTRHRSLCSVPKHSAA